VTALETGAQFGTATIPASEHSPLRLSGPACCFAHPGYCLGLLSWIAVIVHSIHSIAIDGFLN
jgi:hypothetical protein